MGWIALIPMRKGSKGIKNKNVHFLAGIPLFQHTINAATNAKAEAIYISTDIKEILESPKQDGIFKIRRTKNLAGDEIPMADVVLDFLSEGIGADIADSKTIVLLQVTSPLRNSEDIRKALQLFEQVKGNLVISVTDAKNDVLKYGLISGGKFQHISSPEYSFQNRQRLPKVYRPNGAIYIFKAGWFRSKKSFATPSTFAYKMPAERSVDIDTIDDFKLVEKKLF
jgi:CMP-N-acetylneuraminic acid synthetase